MTFYNLDLDEYIYSEIKYIGDPEVDGSWRLIINGTELDAEKRESGVWVAKGGFTA